MSYCMTPQPEPRRRLVSYPDRPIEGLEASRRVGWARFYIERERADGLAVMNRQQRDRLDALLESLMQLVDAVLHERNLDAFATAYRIQALIEEHRNA
jgi:hypothetical protein